MPRSCRALFALFALTAALVGPRAQQQAANARTTRIEGRVLDLRREPVAAATVWLATRHDPDTTLAKVTADGDGHFVLQCVLEPGHSLLRATAPGCCIGEHVVSSADGPVVVFVHDAATVRGVLRNGSFAPVAGARVEATIPFHTTFRARDAAVTAADGSFTLTKVPLGTVSLDAFVPGEGLASEHITLREDTTVTLSANVRAATTIEIVVHGLPPEARGAVALNRSLHGALSELPLSPASLRLDADGKCRLENLPDQEYEFGLHAAGYVLDPVTARLKPGKNAHRVEFTAQLRGSAMLAWPGTLHDADGKPIAGAKIVVGPYAYPDSFTAVTGTDGAFRCECHIAEGRIVSVHCDDPAWSAAVSCAFEPEKPLALVAVPACRAVARVLLADGSAAAFVGSWLVEAGKERGIEVTADRDGRLDLKVPASEQALQLVVTSPAGSGRSTTFQLSKPGTKVDLGDVKLDKPVVIEGVARDAEARPLPGALVRLHSGAIARDWEYSRMAATTRTDRLGRYRFVGPSPGEGWLVLSATAEDQFNGSRSADPFEVAPGEKRTIDLTAAKK